MDEVQVINTTSQLKPSKYNYFVKYDDETYYGYNFLYRSILRIPTEVFAAIQLFLSDLASDETRNAEKNKVWGFWHSGFRLYERLILLWTKI